MSFNDIDKAVCSERYTLTIVGERTKDELLQMEKDFVVEVSAKLLRDNNLSPEKFYTESFCLQDTTTTTPDEVKVKILVCAFLHTEFTIAVAKAITLKDSLYRKTKKFKEN